MDPSLALATVVALAAALAVVGGGYAATLMFRATKVEHRERPRKGR